MTKIYFILSFWIYLGTCFAQGNIIELQIEEINTVNGKIMIAVFNNEMDFKTKQNPVFADTINADSKIVNTTFNTIPNGTYAVAIFHDENSDGNLNTAKLGIPTEGVGFSGSIKSINKPPKFSDCSFVLSNDTSFLIKMHYRSKP